MKKSLLLGVIITLALMGLPVGLHSQGKWIEQTTDNSTNYHLFDKGEDCFGYAKKTSRYIYFFDINSHKWVTADLGNEQTIRDITGFGKTIFAFTDEVAIGYSSFSSTYDTIHYSGKPLNTAFSGMQRGYGCAELAAYFVTDKYFYVYDGWLGIWKSYAYNLYVSYDAQGARFMPGDDYIGVILTKTPPANHAINMAYSMPYHDFAWLEDGNWLWTDGIVMSHGFITYGNHYNESVVSLGGYSALTNRFSTQTILYDDDLSFDKSTVPVDENITEKTTAVFSTKLPTQGQRKQQIFAYSTLTGGWSVANVYLVDPPDESFYSIFYGGGSIAASIQEHYHLNDPHPYTNYSYMVFNGMDSTFHTIDAVANGMESNGLLGPLCGNHAMFVCDSTHFWFCNTTPFNSEHYHHGHVVNDALSFCYGENFMAVVVWDMDQNNPDKVYVFNSLTDNLSGFDLPLINKTYQPVVSPDMFAFLTGGGNSDIYFYSGVTDSHLHIPNIQMGFIIDINHRLGLAYTASGSLGYLYNANLNFASQLTFIFQNHKLGKRVALFSNNNKVYGWNINNLTYTHVEFDENPGLYATGDIGLVQNIYRDRFYAYNGFFGTWIELIPSGTNTAYAVAADKTALVIRKDRIYAFDPEIVAGIPETTLTRAIYGFELMQNYPNPFGEMTQIPYTLTKSGHVTLKIFDNTGKSVSVLFNGYQTPGEYTFEFNAAGLSEGIYYCVLTMDGKKQNIKMSVIR